MKCVRELSWGWVVCICFLCIFALSAGIAFSFTEMLVPLSQDMNAKFSLLDSLGSLPSALPMLFAPIATFLHFKIGTRKTVFLGIFIASVSLAVTSLLRHVALMFLVYGVCLGLGITFVVNPPFFLLDEYFPYHHPRHVLTTSIIACAYPMATMMFNPITYTLIEKVGWRTTYTVYAVTYMVVGCICAATFKKPNSDEHISLLHTTNAVSSVIGYPSSVEISIKSKVVMGSVWLVSSICKSIGYYTPSLILVKQMVDMGIPQSQASSVMSIMGGCEIASRLLCSFLGDYIKGKLLYIYIVFCACLCILNIFAVYASTYTHIVFYVIMLGMLGGPIIAAMYSSCSEVLFGTSVPMIFTIFRVGLGIGSITGSIIAGAIYDATSSFKGVYIMNCIVYTVATIGYALTVMINTIKPEFVYSKYKSNLHELQQKVGDIHSKEDK